MYEHKIKRFNEGWFVGKHVQNILVGHFFSILTVSNSLELDGCGEDVAYPYSGIRQNFNGNPPILHWKLKRFDVVIFFARKR